MGREILYRGKRIKDGKWVEGLPTKDVKGHVRIQYDPAYFSVVVDPETVGQYTGIDSKKHKTNLSTMIFEDDVFRGFNDNDIEMYYVVMWIKQLAAFYMIPIEHYHVIKYNDVSDEPEFGWLFEEAMLFDFSDDCVLTKIGNIHDNPELLK